ncbi:putative ribonuclease H-like domain-containing protein [Tanacetum coccineum]
MTVGFFRIAPVDVSDWSKLLVEGQADMRRKMYQVHRLFLWFSGMWKDDLIVDYVGVGYWNMHIIYIIFLPERLTMPGREGGADHESSIELVIRSRLESMPSICYSATCTNVFEAVTAFIRVVGSHLAKISTRICKETIILSHSVYKMNSHTIDCFVDIIAQLKSLRLTVTSNVQDKRYVVPTGRVVVPTGRYVVPAEGIKGKNTLLQSIPDDHVLISGIIWMMQKDIWNAYVKARFWLVECRYLEDRKTMLKQEFSKFIIRIYKLKILEVDIKDTSTFSLMPISRLQAICLCSVPPLVLQKDVHMRIVQAILITVHCSINSNDWVSQIWKLEGRLDFDKKESARFNKKKVRCYIVSSRVATLPENAGQRREIDKQRYYLFSKIHKHDGQSDGGDAGEFALMGVTLSEYFIQVQAYKNSLKTLEKQKRVLQKNQLTLEDKIRVLSIELENTTNLLKHSERINAIAETAKKELQTKLDNHLVQIEKWRTSSKNLFRLIDSSMSVRTKVGLGFNNYIRENELGWDDSAFSVFTTNSEEVEGRPLFNRFAKADSMKAVPPPLSGDYTPLSDHIDLDESQMSYGTKSSTSGDSNSVSNDFVSCDNSDKSSEVNTNDFASSDSSVKSSEPKSNDSTSCASTSSVSTSESEAEIESNVGTPIQEPIIVQDLPSFSCNSSDKNENTSRTSCNKNGYFNKKAGHFRKNASSVSKLCFVCGSSTHLIKDCDFYEKQMANKTVGNGVGPVHSRNNVNHQNQFVPQAVLLRTGKVNIPPARPQPVPTGKPKVPAPVPTGRQNRPFPVPTDRGYSPSVTSGWWKSTARPMPHLNRPTSSYFQTYTPYVPQMYYNHMKYGGVRWATAVKPSAGCSWKTHRKGLYWENPYSDAEDEGIFDSGCSRSMTCNMERLDDFQEFQGGKVTFGGGEGRITGKGTIRTPTLDFENVYYVKELQQFNLFSISQIFDKKNRVLFTDTDCLMLSKDFMLPDESMVVLRVPRKHNLYTINLNSLCPRGNLACLVAKASVDESVKWHRRMSHVNYKNMNRLVKGNLVRGLPPKLFKNDHTCVACCKGKQHKASYKAINVVCSISEPLQLLHMDLFGPTSIRSIDHKYYCLVITDDYSRKPVEQKGIKRDYSNARTPQQNGVAERKNRTLIEAARTMLADSKLPTMFWTEAVRTACYVLNRVLVTSPHNKTPYALLTGNIPSVSHFKPFGCHVTILNTSDHLGKFDGKADEGYIVGYSASNRAYRVYNVPNKRVEETMNLRYLEEKPNVQGLGHEWYFDLDYLTDTLGYKRDKANQSARTHEDLPNSAGIQDVDSDSKCDEQVIIIPSYPSHSIQEAVPKRYSSDEVDNTPLDSAEEIFQKELARLKAVQTRSKVNKTTTGESAFISYIHDQQRTNHTDFQHCMFSCFLSQVEPRSVAQALEDPSWVDAMQEEMQQFKF